MSSKLVSNGKTVVSIAGFSLIFLVFILYEKVSSNVIIVQKISKMRLSLNVQWVELIFLATPLAFLHSTVTRGSFSEVILYNLAFQAGIFLAIEKKACQIISSTH